MMVESRKYLAFHFLCCTALIVLLLGACQKEQEQISFNEDIRPIFKDKCMTCHGGVRQQGGLSLLFEDHLYATMKSGAKAIVPGKPMQSEIFKRITTNIPSKQMPPEGNRLSSEEQDRIKKWIEQGAKWETHWAYVTPKQTISPDINSPWIINNIDAFILKKGNQMGLEPSLVADDHTLLRRLNLDVIGLPPSLEDMEKDIDPNNLMAYEKTIDRLLASEHFGEKWASFWLDLARYADSQGFQKDHVRPTMWLYRDWVIHALNNDMPFDSFTIKQLAGDLLPNATDQDHLATAFHRNTMTNDEGGTDDEEYRVRAVMDRVNTTMETWLASTFACVQCHSHPYDPIMHEEYYALKGYFNNTVDTDLTSDHPKMVLLSTAQKMRLSNLEKSTKENKTNISPSEKNAIARFVHQTTPQPVPVMQELADSSSRQNPFFVRGNWTMQEGDIASDVPMSYDKTGSSYRGDRLGLAKWIVDPQNPLTSRVIVNRIWQQIFGTGIIETLEDFGVQGAAASHPALLDYLSYKLMHDYDWQIKPMIKEILMSATYRQSSDMSADQLAQDPSNKYLMRAPRFRLTAEQIRDQALVVSDLLNPEVYGPSVMPHQPEGVWNVIRNVANWETSTDGQAYRRALYTFYRRVSPYPTMLTFDAPSRELCLSRRVETNTPLQALTLMNDPVFTEASEALAHNAIASYPNDPEAQIKWAYKNAICQNISDDKFLVLKKLYDSSINRAPENELNTMSLITSTIFNLDEFLVKR